MLSRLGLSAVLIFGSVICGRSQTPPQQSSPQGNVDHPKGYTVAPGTHIALGMINSVSTKHSSPGDRIYLETVFPIVIDNHIVIPPGSYVTGTVTDVNAELNTNPGLVNTDPHDKAWMIRVKAADPAELEKLLTAEDYLKQHGG